MLAAMDDLAAQFTVLADIEVPRQFSAVGRPGPMRPEKT